MEVCLEGKSKTLSLLSSPQLLEIFKWTQIQRAHFSFLFLKNKILCIFVSFTKVTCFDFSPFFWGINGFSGIYFAPRAQTSVGYTSPTYRGTRFMFACHVALGKSKVEIIWLTIKRFASFFSL